MAAYIAGVDEVGRGPLAGPVIAAAVILASHHPIAGLADSKALSARRREELFTQIQAHCLAWAIGRAEVHEIDTLNILQASLLAMQRAVAGLTIQPQVVLVDGLHCPIFPCPAWAMIGGDGLLGNISAASIMAKVNRDAEMAAMETAYPGYDFAANKGYPTLRHRQALKTLGATPIHRRSFAPVHEALKGASIY